MATWTCDLRSESEHGKGLPSSGIQFTRTMRHPRHGISRGGGIVGKTSTAKCDKILRLVLSVKRRKEPSLSLLGRNSREWATSESPHYSRKEPPSTPRNIRLQQRQIFTDRKMQDNSIINRSDELAVRSARGSRFSGVDASRSSPGENASRSPVPFPCSRTLF